MGSKGLLLSVSHHLESQGLHLQTPPVILGAFQHARQFTEQTALRYATLAARCPLVAAVGIGLPAQPIPGVRGVSLPLDDPLQGEWEVVVIGTHFTRALIAKDLGDTGPYSDRRFAFSLTHEPAIVLAAARPILERVVPSETESKASVDAPNYRMSERSPSAQNGRNPSLEFEAVGAGTISRRNGSERAIFGDDQSDNAIFFTDGYSCPRPRKGSQWRR